MSRVPLHGFPGASSPTGERRKVTRILSPAHQHYEIAATIGPCQREMHSCRPVLDTGAGINLVRPNVLPANWQSYAEKLERTRRIKDANNNRLIANIALCPILPVQNRNKNKNGSLLFKYKLPCFV